MLNYYWPRGWNYPLKRRFSGPGDSDQSDQGGPCDHLPLDQVDHLRVFMYRYQVLRALTCWTSLSSAIYIIMGGGHNPIIYIGDHPFGPGGVLAHILGGEK